MKYLAILIYGTRFSYFDMIILLTTLSLIEHKVSGYIILLFLLVAIIVSVTAETLIKDDIT